MQIKLLITLTGISCLQKYLSISKNRYEKSFIVHKSLSKNFVVKADVSANR